MPEFTYTARDARGEKVSGSVTAVSQREVINILAGQSLFPLEVCNETPSVGQSGSRRVSGRVMATVYSQLSALLRSGVPLLRSIEVICRQTTRPRLKLVLQDVHDRLQDGTAMAEAGTAAAVAREQSELAGAIEAACYCRIIASCRRPGFAEVARYSFPRGDATIEGPSIDLAREIARCWGNMRCGIRIVSQDDE
ncbi:MAG: type II secretion system F family protein, partial [Planctomycetes bacterium]|nr:type II secretion system F family protein [Planctomycetota bacterium]